MTTAPRNTDGRFWAYQVVAVRPDNTGRYRASFIRFSDLYDWSDSALAATIERERVLKTRLIGPMTRAEYDAMDGRCHGYVDAPDASLPFAPEDWRTLA